MFYHMQSNNSDSMDCSGLSNLMFLDVACNRLSSLQGLKDNQQLLEINLSENRLTRIGELFQCKVCIVKEGRSSHDVPNKIKIVVDFNVNPHTLQTV